MAFLPNKFTFVHSSPLPSFRWQDGAGSITFHLSLIPCCYEKWKMQLNALLKPSPRVLFTILPALKRLSTMMRTLFFASGGFTKLWEPICKLKHSISSSKNKFQFVIKEYSLNKHSVSFIWSRLSEWEGCRRFHGTEFRFHFAQKMSVEFQY